MEEQIFSEIAVEKEALTRLLLILTRHSGKEDNEFATKAVDKVEQKVWEYDQMAQHISIEGAIKEVLKDYQRSDLVELYEDYCKEKEAVYNSLSVTTNASPTQTLWVGPTAADEYLPWNRARIAQALEREGGLPKGVAEEVAWEVEQKVIRSGSHYITTALIRELVNSELFLKGYRYYLQKQSILGIPKFDLNSFLYLRNEQTTAKSIQNLIEKVALNTFRQYALEEVFSKEVITSHLSGALHIEYLEWPIKLYSLAIAPPQNSKLGKFASHFESLVSFLSLIEQLSPFAAHHLNLYNMGNISWDTSLIRSFFIGITKNFQNAAPLNILFKKTPEGVIDLLHQIYCDVDKINRKELLPELFVQVPELLKSSSGLKKICYLALKMQKVRFYFRQNNFFAGEHPQPKCAMDTIVINLVRPAYKAGQGRIESFWLELKEVFDVVLKAHLDKRRFLINLAQGPLYELLEGSFKDLYSLEESSCFLEICGLPEAIRLLCDCEITEEKGWELALEILKYLAQLTHAIHQRHNTQIKLVSYSYSQVGPRFSKLDMARFPKLKELFTEPYTLGPHFPSNTKISEKERLFKEGQLHQYIPACIALCPPKDSKSLKKLLVYVLEETQVAALRIWEK